MAQTQPGGETDAEPTEHPGQLPDDHPVAQVMADLRSVEAVVRYQTTHADVSIILGPEETQVNEVRAEYLRNLREDWAWVESSDIGRRYVLLERKDY